MSSSKYPLRGYIALVTGASRGIGKGIALQLCEAGALVYVTGRTVKPKADGAGGSLEETIEEMKARGGGVGSGVAVQCDHGKDEDIVHLFEKIDADNDGRLDILVNNAFSGVAAVSDQMGVPFWEQRSSTWDEINHVGLRNSYICAMQAAKRMVARQSGLIVNVSSAGGLKYLFNVPYGVGKAATDRMMADCAVELKKHGVACISLWPGPVKTEEIMHRTSQMSDPGFGDIPADRMAKLFEKGESPEFPGKCIAALAADPKVMVKTGKILMTADLASEYDLKDDNGLRPLNMRSLKTGLLSLGGVYAAAADFVPSWIQLPRWILHLLSNKF